VKAHYTRLKGLRVFVVEDEFAVLLLIEDMLSELECELVGSTSRVAEAIRMLRDCSPDVAVLDVNVAGEPVYPVAEYLAGRDVPVVFSTGYGDGSLGERWRSRPVLQKPYVLDQLAAALLTSIGQQPGVGR
jgi:CheY-like chemotaxis protein